MKKFIFTTLILFASINPAFARGQQLQGDYSADLSAFQKWTGVMAKVKMPESKGTLTGQAALDAMRKIHYGWYEKNYSYIRMDPKDIWKTPAQFARDKGGDCEDFAIADYFAGVKARIPENDMEIVVGIYLPTMETHAVLRLHVDDEFFYFQGITTRAIPDDEYRQIFFPYYGINRHHWESGNDPDSRP